MALRSKALVCSRWLAGIVGSNIAGGMDIRLWLVLCVGRYRSLRQAEHKSRRVLRGACVRARARACVCVCVCDRAATIVGSP
jgi:hypothetical protein